MQVLSQWVQYRGAGAGESGAMQRFSVEELHGHLPFWSILETDRIARSLQDKGIIEIDSPPLGQSDTLCFRFSCSSTRVLPAQRPPVAGATLMPRHWSPDENTLASLQRQEGVSRQFASAQIDAFVCLWHERAEPAYSWNEKFRCHVLAAWRRAPQSVQAVIDGRWHPSADAMAILEMAGVERPFIEDAVPEFILYWQEKDPAAGTWDSKFVQHIKSQWRSWQVAMEKGVLEPGQMPLDWQPSAEFYDTLKMTGIDLQFAQEKVREFVLYWRDRGQPVKSWNSVFLRHVKREWACRHALGNTAGKWDEFVQRHTDRAWRHGA